MNYYLKKPLGFFIGATIFLVFIGLYDYGLFHFMVDFFTVTMGFMIFIVVLNSKLHTRKSVFLILSVAYLYVSCLDLAHLVTFFDIGNNGILFNQSFTFYVSARVFEVVSVIMLFLFLNTVKNLNYRITQVIGMTLFLLVMGLILSGFSGTLFIYGEGLTTYGMIINYVTGFLYLVAVIVVFRSKMNSNQRKVFMFVFAIKAGSLFFHPYTGQGGNILELIAMILRFVSYGGLYYIFIREIITDPYAKVYELFETKHNELLSLSQRDSLTGIYNHSLTFQNIEELIKGMGTKYKELCVILIDIDNFKGINDSFGHIKGDEMLIAFTSLLDSIEYENRMLGRYGGDEFILALPNCKEEDIPQIFMELNSALLDIAEQTGVLITFSSGVVFWHIGDNATDLIRKADIKMYESKDKGKNQYSIWKQNLTKK